jgi:hypothetical protein
MKFNCPLYLVCRWFVMVALVTSLAGNLAAQTRKQRGPRALAVLEMGPPAEVPAPTTPERKPMAVGVGFPRLRPITVLENGNYNDATIYQATPVPLALQIDVVYDVQRGGVPQGQFTVKQPSQLHGAWVAVGSWQPGLIVNAGGEKPFQTQKPEDDAPPRLKRGGGDSGAGKAAQAKKIPNPSLTQARWLVAVSDDGTYDPRPYDYAWTPEWKRCHTAEMLALAQQEFASYTRCRAGAKSCTAKLEDVEVRAFDLETNNDVELVLTARARRIAGSEQYVYLVVIGRVGWQAQVTRVFASVTDDAHLDTTGRMEFIDAVDADGDGRGELLFRRVHNSTQSFELFRVGREQVWKLFDGAEASL